MDNDNFYLFAFDSFMCWYGTPTFTNQKKKNQQTRRNRDDHQMADSK